MSTACLVLALWVGAGVVLCALWALIGYRTNHHDYDDEP